MGNGIAYTWDEAKRKANIAKHGVDFRAVEGFDWHAALVALDARENYGEDRYIALGRIGGRVHVLVFTPRGEKVRVISLRRANRKERIRYGKG